MRVQAMAIKEFRELDFLLRPRLVPSPLRCVYPFEKRSVQRISHSLAIAPECLLAPKFPYEVYVYRMAWSKALPIQLR